MAKPEVTVRSGDDGPPIPVGELVRRLLQLAWSHRRVAWPAAVATIAFQGLTLAGLAGQGLAIDVVRHHFDGAAPAPKWPAGFAPPQDWGFPAVVAAVATAVMLASLLAGLARFLVRYCDELFVQACVVDLRQRLYEKLQKLPLGFFDTIDTGQIINRVTGDSQQVRSFIQGIMIRAGIAIITLAIFLGYMVSVHPVLTAACCLVFPVQVMVMLRFSRITKPKYLEQSKLTDVLIKVLQESIAGIRVIRVFGRAAARTALFDEKSAAAAAQSMSIARDQGLHVPVVGATNYMAQAALLGLGGWLVLQGPAEGGIALGTLWVFRGLLDRLAGQAEAIVSIIGETPEALAGAERVFKLLDRPVEIESPAAEADAAPEMAVRGDIEFRHVTFGYDPARPVLHDVSFKARAGETIALVGPTGAGKSTLLGLISRLYDAQAGAVLVDGVDVRRWDLTRLRRGVGMVFQEPFLFSNTIGSNIAFGAPEADEPRVSEAARAAAAEGFIREAAEGYQTIIGERGVSLSGGQRQRLTIARALLTKPGVLILDDATGSIDALTESEIQASLDRYMQGRTTFIVAHRLSTLRRADRIIVLEKGRIIDVGSHAELMQRPGHYRAAALIQLALDESDAPAARREGAGGAAEGGAA